MEPLGLTINALPVNVQAEAQLKVWSQPYTDENALRSLRYELRQTHLVRRNGTAVDIVPFLQDTSTPGEQRSVELNTRPELIEALLIEWLLRSMRTKGMACRKD